MNLSYVKDGANAEGLDLRIQQRANSNTVPETQVNQRN